MVELKMRLRTLPESEELEDVSDTEQIKVVKTFNVCVATVDRLMKRWLLVHLGWNTNPQLAKADAEANAFESERVDLQNAPIEAFFIVLVS